MSDLRIIMLEAAGSTPAPTDPALAEADVARGRRARRRHRVARVSAGSGLVLAAAVLGGFLIASPTPSPAGPSASVGGPASTSVKLVSYTGEQAAGYTLDRVPEGWAIQTSGQGGLTLAPEGATDDNVSSDGVVSLIDRIAVSQEGAVPSGVVKDEVEVDGRPGVIAHMLGAEGDPDGTLTLFLQQPSGNYLSIQVWRGIGWSNDQIAEFASGVHITNNATVSRG